ncbi:type IV toxin-antitoxin system AbiEi family antitoxin [bacterium]|nr:type IV toxin-antitoxin system AbiEi family antitoxin [bacterium]
MNIKKQNKPTSLAQLVDSYQSSGKYTFLRDEAITALGLSKQAIKKAVERLVAKQRLAVPRRGFYVIVPLEYRQAEAPPPIWFIDDLMRFHGCSYYVGLLSAAAIHGAAHQQPQEFQVIAPIQLRQLNVGRARIRFFTKQQMKHTPIQEVKTETGSMRVSTPEATALDLVRYMENAGHLNHVATVLSELADRLDAGKLISAAEQEPELAHVQRLGYLLDQVGVSASLSTQLAEWITKKKPTSTALRADKPTARQPTDRKWKVRVNEKIEVDEV